jgi:hypothetical protein
MQKSHVFSSLIYNCYSFRDARFIASKNFVAMAHRSESSLVPIQLRQDYSGLNKKIELTLYLSICSTWFIYELAAGSTYIYSTLINSSLWIHMNISYIFLFVSMLHIFFISHSSETDEQWWSGGSLLCRCISSIPGQQLKLHRQLIWTCRKLVIEPWFCKLKINSLWSWDDDQHLGRRGLQGSIVSNELPKHSRRGTLWHQLQDAREF